MEDDSFQHAPLVLRHADRDHCSMLPRSHWRMRLLYLGIVSDGLQTLPLDTSISIRSAMAEGLLSIRRGLSLAGFHRTLDRRP